MKKFYVRDADGEEYEVEEMLRGVLDYASEKFNVDFSIKNFYQNALIVEAFEY